MSVWLVTIFARGATANQSCCEVLGWDSNVYASPLYGVSPTGYVKRHTRWIYNMLRFSPFFFLSSPFLQQIVPLRVTVRSIIDLHAESVALAAVIKYLTRFLFSGSSLFLCTIFPVQSIWFLQTALPWGLDHQTSARHRKITGSARDQCHGKSAPVFAPCL